MSKVKLLTVVVVLLVLLNIGTLTALFMGRPGHHGPPRGEGPKAIIIERLHFDADQAIAYEALIMDHRQTIDVLDEAMMDARDRLYSELRGSDRAGTDSLIAIIGSVQQRVERTHSSHFSDIRALCRQDQLPAFDALVDDLATYFSRGPKPGGPPPPKH